ncbi:MAG: DEAD/DEAH box helicase family protein, partial [Candidatus Zixiibacteriota bacterium]
MAFKLEQLEYQEKAIKSIVNVFNGQIRNNYQNSTKEGIRTNYLSLSEEEIKQNIKNVIKENGIPEETAKLSDIQDVCIEMETGTGKTLVYLKTIYELFNRYGFTKFIILVPSVAIKEGVISAFKMFKEQLNEMFNIEPKMIEYDSKHITKLIGFIEEQHPQILVLTVQSFNSDDKVLHRANREDLFANIAYIEAIGKTNPIIIMDEPQVSMSTDNFQEKLQSLNPMINLRYSATHKEIYNLVYRLTPYDSYKQGLVKKIELLTVSERHDEAN